MKYQVMMSDDAEADLFDIFKYVATSESVARANVLMEKLEHSAFTLETNPQRGRVPPELLEFGVIEFLEIDVKPYRFVYRLGRKRVYIHCVLDGRRDMERLLQERLLR
ncbi:MAG: type II toxin-antitoxin system RelE/ParE family toxin [Bacteroidota bacterium]|jgi:toxin ParE1/3/4